MNTPRNPSSLSPKGGSENGDLGREALGWRVGCGGLRLRLAAPERAGRRRRRLRRLPDSPATLARLSLRDGQLSVGLSSGRPCSSSAFFGDQSITQFSRCVPLRWIMAQYFTRTRQRRSERKSPVFELPEVELPEYYLLEPLVLVIISFLASLCCHLIVSA